MEDLRSGEAALEERARGELGMIKPGEVFIQVIERPKPVPARGHRSQPQPHEKGSK